MTNFSQRNNALILKRFGKEQESLVRRLFASGLIRNLVNQNLVPPTFLSKNKRTPLIRQKRIETLTYPHEWSFSMLKDAAICTLKVNLIANQYGFQIQDAHPHNIVFDRDTPKFVDIGSFIVKRPDTKGWCGSEEFLRTFYYPLTLWARDFNFITYSSLLSTLQAFPHAEYLRLRYPLTRLIPSKIFSLFLYYFPYSRLSSVDTNVLQQKLSPKIFRVVNFFIKHNLLLFQGFNSQSYFSKIEKLVRLKKNYWSGYLPISEPKVRTDRRFLTIARMLKKRKIKSIVDGINRVSGYLSLRYSAWGNACRVERSEE